METPLSLTEEQMRSLKEHGLCILVGTVQGTLSLIWTWEKNFMLLEGLVAILVM